MKYLLPLLATLFLTACNSYNDVAAAAKANYSEQCINYAMPADGITAVTNDAILLFATKLEGCKTRETTAALIKETTDKFCN